MELKKVEGAALQQDDQGRPFSDLIGEFQPFAYYDKHLDCIRVHIHDCSAVEERQNRIFTVMRALHSNAEVTRDDFAGFNIKGVRYLFKEMSFGMLDKQACYKVAEILTAIVKHFPNQGVQEVSDKVQPILERCGLEVEIDFEPAVA